MITFTMRLLVLLLLPALSHAQSFATLEGQVVSVKGDYQPGWSMTFTGGGFLNNKGDRSMMLGLGITANFYSPNNVIGTPFATFGYFNPKKKITPYVNARVGYNFFKGSGDFAGAHSNRGGFYTSIQGGAGFKVTKIMRITPYIGLDILTLRYVVGGETKESSTAGLAKAGIALVFTR